MKLKNLARLTLVVLLCSIAAFGQSSTPMITPKQISELEYRLEELDKLPDNSITVKLTKSERSSTDKTLDFKLRLKSKTTNNTLLDVNLSQLAETEQLDAMIAKTMTSTTMCGGIPSVLISQIGATRDYVVEGEYIYDRTDHKLTVPKGLIFDRASIPRIFWLLISPDDLGNVAPLLHDYLYRNGGKLPKNHVNPYRTYSRRDTDDLFLEVMTKCGVEPWRRKAAYDAVRLASDFAWKDK
jgi:hypothetical protein